jgi:hypothetical protein
MVLSNAALTMHRSCINASAWLMMHHAQSNTLRQSQTAAWHLWAPSTCPCGDAPAVKQDIINLQHPHHAPQNLNPAPHTLHPASITRTQHLATMTQHPAPRTQHPAPCTCTCLLAVGRPIQHGARAPYGHGQDRLGMSWPLGFDGSWADVLLLVCVHTAPNLRLFTVF